jgi:hypothetical protein
VDFDRAAFTALVATNIEGSATREAIFDLLDFSLKHAFKVTGGKDSRSFHYVVATRAGSAMLFYCGAHGDVEVALGNFPSLTTAEVSRFARRLSALSPGFRYLQRFEDRRLKGGTQGFLVNETLVDPGIMREFKAAVLALQEEIDS